MAAYQEIPGARAQYMPRTYHDMEQQGTSYTGLSQGQIGHSGSEQRRYDRPSAVHTRAGDRSSSGSIGDDDYNRKRSVSLSGSIDSGHRRPYERYGLADQGNNQQKGSNWRSGTDYNSESAVSGRLNRPNMAENVSKQESQEARSMDARKSQSALQSRILSYSEAESLKLHEGLRRQSQQRDAEMKIKSIHSRMAALEKELLLQDLSDGNDSRRRMVTEAKERAPEQEVTMERKSVNDLTSTPKNWRSPHSMELNILHNVSTKSSSPRADHMAVHHEKGVIGLTEKPSYTSEKLGSGSESADMVQEIYNSVTDLLNVLSSIRQELGISKQFTSNDVRPIDPGTSKKEQEEAIALGDRPGPSLVQCAPIDIDKSLMELRERAKAREKLIKNLNRQPADVEPRITIDDTGSTSVSAKLFERAHELERSQEKDERNVSDSLGTVQATDETPSLFKRELRGAQRSAAPPPARDPVPEVQRWNDDQWEHAPALGSFRVPSASGQYEAQAGMVARPDDQSDVASRPFGETPPAVKFDDPGRKISRQTSREGSFRANSDNHPLRGRPAPAEEDTPVMSASLFSDYTEGTALPPGWEFKIDQPTGRKFYVNHELKAISWDRPRASLATNVSVTRSPSASRQPTRMGDVNRPMSGTSIPTQHTERGAGTRSAAPALLNRVSPLHGVSRKNDSGQREGRVAGIQQEGDRSDTIAPRYVSSDRLGSSMDGIYYEREERRKAETEVHRRHTVAQHSSAFYDQTLFPPSAPKRWTASTFLDHLDSRLLMGSQLEKVSASGFDSNTTHHSLLRTSLDSSRLAALERQATEEDKQAHLPFSVRPSVRDRLSTRMTHQQYPDTETLNLLVTAKDKLRNYLFSSVDVEESFDTSPVKVIDRQTEELMYAQWCAESLHHMKYDHDDEDDQGGVLQVGSENTDTATSKGGVDTSWTKSSLTREEMENGNVKAWQV